MDMILNRYRNAIDNTTINASIDASIDALNKKLSDLLAQQTVMHNLPNTDTAILDWNERNRSINPTINQILSDNWGLWSKDVDDSSNIPKVKATFDSIAFIPEIDILKTQIAQLISTKTPLQEMVTKDAETSLAQSTVNLEDSKVIGLTVLTYSAIAVLVIGIIIIGIKFYRKNKKT